MKDLSKTILLHIDKETSTFSFEDSIFTTPIGYELLTNKYLKNTPPTYNEIEYAINYIEDEIEKVVPKLPQGKITTKDKFIIDFAKDGETELFRDDIESLFGEYAEVSAGRVPSASQNDLSPTFYAKLLILREYLHHLKFESIKLV